MHQINGATTLFYGCRSTIQMQNIENCKIYRFNLLIAVCLCNKVMNSNQIWCYFNFVFFMYSGPFFIHFSNNSNSRKCAPIYATYNKNCILCAIKITVHFIVSGIVLPSIFVHLQTVIDVILWRCIHLIAKCCLMLIQKYFLFQNFQFKSILHYKIGTMLLYVLTI